MDKFFTFHNYVRRLVHAAWQSRLGGRGCQVEQDVAGVQGYTFYVWDEDYREALGRCSPFTRSPADSREELTPRWTAGLPSISDGRVWSMPQSLDSGSMRREFGITETSTYQQLPSDSAGLENGRDLRGVI